MKRAIKIIQSELLQYQLNLDTHKALLKHSKFHQEKYQVEIAENKAAIVELKEVIRILKKHKTKKP